MPLGFDDFQTETTYQGDGRWQVMFTGFTGPQLDWEMSGIYMVEIEDDGRPGTFTFSEALMPPQLKWLADHGGLQELGTALRSMLQDEIAHLQAEDTDAVDP